MNDDELERALQMAEWQVAHGPISQQYAADFVLKLLHEDKQLRAENAAMRPIVEAVATSNPLYYSTFEGTFCTLCKGYMPGNVAMPDRMAIFPHTSDCLRGQARALVG